MNCWEFKKCGREIGGKNVEELGICTAYPNYGRSCAHISGTLCSGRIHGIFASKLSNCLKCDFYKSSNYVIKKINK
jgi:hypothetical protein